MFERIGRNVEQEKEMLKTRNVGQEMHRNLQLCSAVGNPYYYTKHHRDCGLVQSGVLIGGNSRRFSVGASELSKC